MDFLGIGFAELIFILIIAMMVFGPRRLPEMAAKAGKIVADLRNMSQGLMAEWQREITVAARLDDLQKTRQEIAQVGKDLKQAQQSVSKETGEVAKQIAAPAAKPAPQPPAPDGSEPSPETPVNGAKNQVGVPVARSSATTPPQPADPQTNASTDPDADSSAADNQPAVTPAQSAEPLPPAEAEASNNQPPVSDADKVANGQKST